MRFQIELEGVVGAPPDVLEAALDAAMGHLVDREVVDPSVGGTLATGRVEVSFLVDGGDTEEALARAHAVARDAFGSAPFEITWAMVRAEAVAAADRASL